MKSELIDELKELIFTTCHIEDVTPEELGADDPLTGPDSLLGLDSIDAVELVVEIQKKYKVRIDSRETSRQVLGSLRILAEFIDRQRQS